MTIILVLFATHWALSCFFQSFFHHRYASHRMFTMTPRAERVFHALTYVVQGSSYLSPRAYAVLHREHHAYSDTERDPHAPGYFGNVFSMMWTTALRYAAHLERTSSPEPRFRTTRSGRSSTGSARRGSRASPGVRRTGSRISSWRPPGGSSAAASPLAHGPDPRRDRELVRAPLRLPQLPDDRRVA
jgi:hypothetical protein